MVGDRAETAHPVAISISQTAPLATDDAASAARAGQVPFVFQGLARDGSATQGLFRALSRAARTQVKAVIVGPSPLDAEIELTLRLGDLMSKVMSAQARDPIYMRQWPVWEWPAGLQMAARAVFREPFQDLASVARLWIGAQGAYTPTHADDTDNLLFQLRGRKRVLLWPPWYNNGNGPPLGQEHKTDHVVLLIGPGDTLFLPAGWAHHVTALDGAISVNAWHPDARKMLARIVS